MIADTAHTSAIQAVKLSQLLKKKWSEEKNAYKIMSGINTERQKRRYDAIMRGEL